MNEPRRLMYDPEATSFERDLLGSWSSEEPSAGARARVMDLASIAAVAAAGVAAASLGAKAAGGSMAPKAMATGAAAIAKWLAVGVVVVSGATAASVAYTRRDRGETATATTPTSATRITTTSPTIPTVAPTMTATATATTATTAAAPAAPPVEAVPHAGVAARPHDTLPDQIGAMDGVRSAIASGEGGRALRLIDDYERRFPRGAFGEEAEALRVEAIARTGNGAAASRAAERFLAAHPGSPHAARVRARVRSPTP